MEEQIKSADKGVKGSLGEPLLNVNSKQANQPQELSSEPSAAHNQLNTETEESKKNKNHKEKKSHKNQPKKTKLSNLHYAAVLMSIMFCYVGFLSAVDFPQTLGDILLNHFKITTEQVGIIYSINTGMSILTSAVTGFLVLKFGVPNVILGSTATMFLGSLIIFWSVKINYFNLLLFGRGVFALGAETTAISQATASSKWFSGKVLSLSMGLNFSMGIASASISNYVNPILIVKTRSLEVAFFYYSCVMAFSCLSAASFNYLDWRYGAALEEEKRQKLEEVFRSVKEDNQALIPIETEEGHQQDPETIRKSILEEENELTRERDYQFQFSDLLKLGPVFWFSVSIYTVAANTYYQFTSIITNAAVHRYGYPYLQAKNFLPVMQVISGIFMPLNSLVIIKIGKKPKVIFFAVILQLIGFLNFTLTPAVPGFRFELSIGLIACFYFIYQSTIYPCLAMSLPDEVVSLGIGAASSVQAVVLCLLSFVFGDMVKEETISQYQRVLIIMAFMSGISLTLTLLTIKYDKQCGGVLDYPENSNEAAKAKSALNLRFRRLTTRRKGRGKGKTIKSVSGKSKLTVGTIRAETEFRTVTSSQSGKPGSGVIALKGEDDLDIG